MLYRGLVVALLCSLFPFSAVQALQVKSQGNGEVFIGDALSPNGKQPDIFLLRRGNDGRELRVPLHLAEGVEVEIRGNDMLIRNADAGGRFHQLQVERHDVGNRQRVKISLGGSGNNYEFSASSRSGSAAQSAWPRPADRDYVPPIPGVWAPPSSYQRMVPYYRSVKKSDSPEMINRSVSGEDWQGRDLKRVSIVNCTIEGSNLAGVNLSDAKIVNTRLDANDLAGANFSGARLVNTDLSNSNLRGSNFSRARLVNAEFSNADLSGAVWIDDRVCAEGSVGSCQ